MFEEHQKNSRKEIMPILLRVIHTTKRLNLQALLSSCKYILIRTFTNLKRVSVMFSGASIFISRFCPQLVMLGIDLALNILSAAMLAFVSSKYDFLNVCPLNKKTVSTLTSQEVSIINVKLKN